MIKEKISFHTFVDNIYYQYTKTTEALSHSFMQNAIEKKRYNKSTYIIDFVIIFIIIVADP